MSRKQGKEWTMRKVREILRLGLVCQLSQRRIAQSCHMSQASVSKFLNLAKQREIEGAQVSQFSDEELMKALGLNSSVHSILKKGLVVSKIICCNSRNKSASPNRQILSLAPS